MFMLSTLLDIVWMSKVATTPQNILFQEVRDSSGAVTNSILKVIDFGFARILNRPEGSDYTGYASAAVLIIISI